MIVTISQPRYLPWLGYFHRIATSDLFIYLDTVQYTPRDWENRNKVKTDRGWTWLTVPVKADYRALIPAVLIDNEQAWQQKHWRTLKTYYGSAPYFQFFEKQLRALYEGQRWDRLLDLNISATQVMCECLGITQARFAKASEIGAGGTGSKMILNLCKAVGATVYLSGSQGANYLDEAEFRDAGVGVCYQEYRHPQYGQLHGEFEPLMAVVDLLFNCGPKSLEVLMKNQDPIEAPQGTVKHHG